MSDLALLAVPALVAFAGALLLRASPLARRLLDRPNERSLHTEVTARVGGIALIAGALAVAAVHATPDIAILLGCAVLLALVSAVDDARSLPVQVRLPAHLAAATVAFLAIGAPLGIESPAGWVEGAVAVLAIAWMTNLFNFMDGADGLAGGMAAIGFAALAFTAFASGAMAIAWCCAALASASAGFLVLNFPPARVFMGDAGSIPLGFLAGALGLAGIVEDAWPLWFPLLVFSPFIVDASVTLLRRLAHGERIWRAHRQHAYQRLVLGGWSKRRLALWGYALMIAVAVSACVALRQDVAVRWFIISVWVAAYVPLLAAIERHRAMVPASDQETPASGFGQ